MRNVKRNLVALVVFTLVAAACSSEVTTTSTTPITTVETTTSSTTTSSTTTTTTTTIPKTTTTTIPLSRRSPVWCGQRVYPGDLAIIDDGIFSEGITSWETGWIAIRPLDLEMVEFELLEQEAHVWILRAVVWESDSGEQVEGRFLLGALGANQSQGEYVVQDHYLTALAVVQDGDVAMSGCESTSLTGTLGNVQSDFLIEEILMYDYVYPASLILDAAPHMRYESIGDCGDGPNTGYCELLVSTVSYNESLFTALVEGSPEAIPDEGYGWINGLVFPQTWYQGEIPWK